MAAAGGVVLSPENRRRLAADDIDVVWLRASPITLDRRVRASGDTHRPLLDADPEGMLERMSVERTPLYEAVADRVVDVDDLAPVEVARIVVDGAAAGHRP